MCLVKRMRLYCVLSIFFLFFCPIQAKRKLKILINSPAFGYSHLAFQGRLADLLVEAGHEVHVYIPNWEANEKRNGTTKAHRIVRFLPTSLDYDFEQNSQLSEPFQKQDENVGAKVWENFKTFTLRQCQDQLKDSEYTESIRRGNFDVAMSEMHDSCALFHFDQAKILTLLMTSNFQAPDIISVAWGLPLPRSFVGTWLLPSVNAPHLSWFDRALNALIDTVVFSQLVEHQNLIGREFAAHYKTPAKTYVEVLKQVKYVFTNQPEMLEHARPITYKFKAIGGIHLRPPGPLLPELEEVFHRAKDGVVLFNFGSNIDMNKMPETMKAEVLAAFSSFPTYSFLWRIEPKEAETREMLAKHPNVHPVAWIDQISVLGINSVIECGYFAKPAIAIPFFNDQYQNAALLLRRGTAVHVDKHEIRTDTLVAALERVLNDPTFTENAKKLSEKLRNSPIDPRETFVKFVEYAATFDSNDELDVPGKHLHWIVLHNWDIYAPISLVFFLFLYVLFRIISARMSAQIGAPADGHLARKAQELRRSHPDRCAVVVEKAASEKLLPDLRKNKFLVPFDQEFVKFSQVIQKRLNLHENQTIVFMVGEHRVPSACEQMGSLHEKYRGKNDVLRLTYMSESFYG
ncbi:Glucuronosyltransferase [Aphelenchoides fujianensis]|nr:Glucuronosyltransferase [Aphelenchoides fujianensis]